MNFEVLVFDSSDKMKLDSLDEKKTLSGDAGISLFWEVLSPLYCSLIKLLSIEFIIDKNLYRFT